jgi:hypothetical protein
MNLAFPIIHQKDASPVLVLVKHPFALKVNVGAYRQRRGPTEPIDSSAIGFGNLNQQLSTTTRTTLTGEVLTGARSYDDR